MNPLLFYTQKVAPLQAWEVLVSLALVTLLVVWCVRIDRQLKKENAEARAAAERRRRYEARKAKTLS